MNIDENIVIPQIINVLNDNFVVPIQNIKKKTTKKVKKNQHNDDIDDYLSIIHKKCEQLVPQVKKQMKVEFCDEDGPIYVPKINEYEMIYKYKYSIDQLKTISKSYKLKVGGNKNELINRIFCYLKLSSQIIFIQKIFRGHLQRKFNKLHGPAILKREICTNTTDFFTMDELTDIDPVQFFSYKDVDGRVYGFDIISLYNLISKTEKNGESKNPYNRASIPDVVKDDIKSLVRIGKIINQRVEIEIKDNINELSLQKSIEMRTVDLFQRIDMLGNYSNPVWFLSLNRMQLVKTVRELIDIWDYRAQITNEVKRAICPPNGDPFSNMYIPYLMNENDIDKVRKVVLEVFEKLLNPAATDDNKSLGAIYILGSLTLVNSSAASALPWLYQTFSHF